MWRSLTIYISLAVILPVALTFGVRALELGWPEAFRHVAPVGVLVGAIAIVGLATFISLMVALWFRAMSVRLTDDFIEGRNSWCRKKRIPLRDITDLSSVSTNGIDAVVVSSAQNGKIYISVHTQHLPELTELLETYLPMQKND
jgi:hypothetical protein